MQRHPVRQAQRSNDGPTTHGAGKSQDPVVVHEVSGEIRWVDAELQRIVVHVTEAGSHAGPTLGRDLTYDLGGARIATEDADGDGRHTIGDLLPGLRVRVRTRIARSLTTKVPDLLQATSVLTLPVPAGA